MKKPKHSLSNLVSGGWLLNNLFPGILQTSSRVGGAGWRAFPSLCTVSVILAPLPGPFPLSHSLHIHGAQSPLKDRHLAGNWGMAESRTKRVPGTGRGFDFSNRLGLGPSKEGSGETSGEVVISILA